MKYTRDAILQKKQKDEGQKDIKEIFVEIAKAAAAKEKKPSASSK